MTARRPASAGGRSRREKGTGSITSYETKAGRRWRYEIEVSADPRRTDDETLTVSRAGFTSYADAEDGLTLLRADTLRGVPQVVSRDTFGACGRRWLEGHPVSNGTRLYIQRVLDAMDPYIGSVRMADIRPTDLAAAYRGLENGTKQIPSRKRRQKGLAPSTVPRYGNWVNSIFLAAADDGLIHKNPANSKHAGRPRGERARRVKPFVIGQVKGGRAPDRDLRQDLRRPAPGMAEGATCVARWRDREHRSPTRPTCRRPDLPGDARTR